MEQEPVETFYNSPIANPLANDSLRAKILKLVRHLNREKNLKRGVKDVVKAIKKGSKGICVLAGDVNPADVISHIPVLCEDAGIPYIFVRSRMELGVAAETKKPTSVVLLTGTKTEELKQKFDKLHGKILASHPYF
jgi:H/ACA ribonucleoprotein complex subunit 2